MLYNEVTRCKASVTISVGKAETGHSNKEDISLETTQFLANIAEERRVIRISEAIYLLVQLLLDIYQDDQQKKNIENPFLF
ncbi:hypothetical protein ACTXT7_014827 [Hymenolepis weldensis]